MSEFEPRSYYLSYGEHEFWLWPNEVKELKAAAIEVATHGTPTFVTIHPADGGEADIFLTPRSVLVFRPSGND